MKKRQIVNIINFIRGVEPRENVDLVEPVVEQISLMKKHNLKGTFLLQYDALCDSKFTDILRELDPTQFEIGIWFEVVQPMVEKAGLTWRGRYPWDWHSHCGFSVGYTISERELLVDIIFKDFKAKMGYYPKSFGSWAFDAHTLDYANKCYGLDAACNCKEQWGTDGYNLWGGYYGQGYYPSRNNALCPAQTQKNQIDTPIFRMLGSDPIYQYDSGLDTKRTTGRLGPQGVLTLEPVYKTEAGGGIPSWVDWYLSENFNGNCLTFGYTQAGQENSFGWESMKDGLEYQFDKIAKLVSEGKLEVETLGDTGRWYKNTFMQTPASSIVASIDWKDSGRKSVWYNCKNYRINLYADNGRFWIRDIYMFREDYSERYLDDICTTDDLLYDNLPIVDGNRFSGNGIRSGLYPSSDNIASAQGMTYTEMIYSEEEGSAVVTFTGTPCGNVTFTLTEDGFNVSKTSDAPFCFTCVYNEAASGLPDIERISEKVIGYCFRDYKYSLKLIKGTVNADYTIYPEGNEILISLS